MPLKYSLLALSAITAISSHASEKSKLDEIINHELKGHQAAVLSQSKTETNDEHQKALTAEYRQLEHELLLQQKYQQQLTAQISQLSEAIKNLNSQTDKVRQLKIRLLPLMQKMVATLRQLIESDVPFLASKRNDMLSALEETMKNPELTEAEKLNRIFEAYQSEIAYGTQVESWHGLLQDRQVEFLRVGRIGFYYLTLDGKSAAVWEQGWKQLNETKTKQLTSAIQTTKQYHKVSSLLQLPPVLKD